VYDLAVPKEIAEKAVAKRQKIKMGSGKKWSTFLFL
jgi:hypothetical protein